MSHTGKFCIFSWFFCLLSAGIPFTASAQAVRIMPVGNSITYDENSGDQYDPRPVGDRISYRYKLYQLLTAAGYVFDYTGSESAGNNYFQNPELDDNAGFPGITDAQVAYLMNTGYNLRTSRQITPGPYLYSYPADIILLHIGTNDLDESPEDVRDLLDYIRFSDPDVIILVARIINREVYSSMTTTFNNNVQAMVTSRGDNRIIMVDMENGAGISYATDMYDNLHPAQSGYDKMAAKWFAAIDNLNDAPVIDAIPDQTTNRGTAFTALSLDQYVMDTEDPGYLLTWTYRLQPGTHLSASIDGNRNLNVAPSDNNWTGSETLVLKVLDTGNGAFKKSDSVSVVFNVIKPNELPVISTTPSTTVTVNTSYLYELKATDADPTDVLTYGCVSKPDWLSFTAGSNMGVLTGTPGILNLGDNNNVSLKVNDGHIDVLQNFKITVKNPTGTEDAPVKESMLIYPNPASDRLIISTDDPARVRLQLFDVTGTLKRDIFLTRSSNHEIDISDLEKGMYFFRAYTDNHCTDGKIVKQ